MKIINRYVLNEHVGPFLFALAALTSLLLLQYIARKFGDLVGKGLDWRVIAEFFLLSVPFTVAMTFPMAVLVGVLYAFSRLAAENEVTALKASGISTRSLMTPVLIASFVLAIGMVVFNDQVLPRSNHRLATLMSDIVHTKPTFALKEQVINIVKPEQLYLKAGVIEEGSGTMYDIVIYDLTDPTRRRTLIADSGTIALAPNERDLAMTLYDGVMLSIPTQHPGQLSRVYYKRNRIPVRDIANQFQQSQTVDAGKSDREMSVCEMQVEFRRRVGDYRTKRRDYEEAVSAAARPTAAAPPAGAPATNAPGRSAEGAPVRGIGHYYCRLTEIVAGWMGDAKTAADKTASAAGNWLVGEAAASPVPPIPAPAAPIAPQLGGRTKDRPNPIPDAGPTIKETAASARVEATRNELEFARYQRDRLAIEINKKFALATACIVLALVGAPIALRFPGGGVGVTIGVSFAIFAIYYVCLIGGESLANKGYLIPWVAMWMGNILFLLIGLPLYARMGRESVTARGGGGLLERLRFRREQKRDAARLARRAA